MDPQQYGNLKWVRQYEQIEAKASGNLAFCMQNLLREAHMIPSRDELRGNRMRLEQRLAEQKRREHVIMYERWEAQNRANMQAVERSTLIVSAPSEEGVVEHTRPESFHERTPPALSNPPVAAPSACTD